MSTPPQEVDDNADEWVEEVSSNYTFFHIKSNNNKAYINHYYE